MSLAYGRKTAELWEKAFSGYWARELVELHGRDLSSDRGGGVALELEEVLNMETVLISADLYSCFCGEFCHISCTFNLWQAEKWAKRGAVGWGAAVWDTGRCCVQLSLGVADVSSSFSCELCGRAILPCSSEPGSHWGWKRPLRASNSIPPALPGQPLNCPQVPYLHVFKSLQVTLPLPRAICGNVWQPFPWRNFS